MSWGIHVFDEQTENFNSISDIVQDTFHGLGKIGEYRVLSRTEDCAVIRLENETGEGDMIIYKVFDGVFLIYNDFHMSSYSSIYQAVDTMLVVDYCREGSLTMDLDNDMYYMKKPGNICIDSRTHHHDRICKFIGRKCTYRECSRYSY